MHDIAVLASANQVEALQWISGQPPAELVRKGSMRLRVKTRHGPQMRDCLLRLVLPQTTTTPQVNDGTEQIAAGGGDGARGGGGASATDDHTPDLAAVATRGYVNLDSKDSCLAPGQFAAFYVGDECVGAGVMCSWSPAAAAAAAAGVAHEGNVAAADVGLEFGVGPAQRPQQQQLGGVSR